MFLLFESIFTKQLQSVCYYYGRYKIYSSWRRRVCVCVCNVLRERDKVASKTRANS